MLPLKVQNQKRKTAEILFSQRFDQIRWQLTFARLLQALRLRAGRLLRLRQSGHPVRFL